MTYYLKWESKIYPVAAESRIKSPLRHIAACGHTFSSFNSSLPPKWHSLLPQHGLQFSICFLTQNFLTKVAFMLPPVRCIAIILISLHWARFPVPVVELMLIKRLRYGELQQFLSNRALPTVVSSQSKAMINQDSHFQPGPH